MLQLETWRAAQKLSYAALGELIGVDGSSARRHALGLRMPKPEEMVAYCRATRGEVQPNHFHRLPGVHPAEALRALARAERVA